MNKKNFALYLGFILIIALAFFLRLYRLDERVFHHDEAAVGYFTYKLFNDGIYSYDPSFHGPFMYYVTAWIFRLFGDSDYSARLLPALLGAAMIFLLVPLRRYIGDLGMIIAAFFLAFSPSFLYYSRFYREDIFIAFFSMLMLVCAVKYAEKYATEKYSIVRLFYLFLGASALAIMAALKENAYIAMAIIAFFLLLVFIRERAYKDLAGKFRRLDKKVLFITGEGLFFILVFLVVFSLFYTGKLLDFHGMYAAFEKAISHWYEMHRIQRIGGPYFFYLSIIALYELPILIFGVLGMAYHCGCETKKETLLTILLSYWVAADILYLIPGYYPALGRFLPTSYIPSSIVVFFPLLILGFIAVLKSRNLFFAFLTYWAMTNLIAYSYIQEKVPWLVMNPLLPLVIIAAAYMGELISLINLSKKDEYLRVYQTRLKFDSLMNPSKNDWYSWVHQTRGIAAIIFIVMLSAFFVYSSVNLNYYKYTNPAEPLIQAAQPPQKFSLFLAKINEISSQYQNRSTEIQLTDGEIETQFLWYMRHFNNIKWRASIDSELTAPLIVVHDSDEKHEPDIVQQRLSGYQRLDSAKMSWHFFKPSDITLDYLLYRKMDREPGEYRVVLFYKPRY